MDKVKILVACHKQAEVFSNNVYTPIHVGKALHPKLDLGFQGDDDGDNISKLNPLYCELTAQYWGWKNMQTEYIGLCHYRRYFKTVITEENIDKLMDGCDIILVKKLLLPNNIISAAQMGLIPEDVSLFYLYMKKYHSEIFPQFEQFFVHGIDLYPCNMFVCKKNKFDEFAKWQFGILEDLRKIYPLSNYSRCNRILGYLGEDLLPFYAYLKGWKIKEEPIVSYPITGDLLLQQSVMQRVKNKIRSKLSHMSYSIGDDILAGLRSDGILDNNNKIIL